MLRAAIELLERRRHLLVLGLEPHRLGEVGDGAIALAVGAAHLGARIVGVGEIRAVVDRLGEIRDRALEILGVDRGAGAHVAVIPGDAAQVVEIRAVRGEPDRRARIRDGGVGIELRHVGLAAGVNER